MLKIKKRTGFTLIELLVVIAIIGILASVVIVSFPGAQKKARDSRIISAIGQLRTVMVIAHGDYGHYDEFKSGSTVYTDIGRLETEITNQGGALKIGHKPLTNSTEACMYSALNAGGWYYCADSTGVAGRTRTDPSTTCIADGETGEGTAAACPTDLQD